MGRLSKLARKIMDNDIASALIDVQEQIRSAEREANRPEGSVALLAASKKQSIEKIKAAYLAGQHSFGENYLQEALPKIQALTHLKGINWHYIGAIQSNKTRKLAEHFAWVQTIDEAHIAQRLNDQRPLHLPKLNICIEVNVDAEKSKSGVTLEQVFKLALHCKKLQNLRLRGLMCIPKIQNDLQLQRKAFNKLYLLFKELNAKGLELDTLSMGMSADFKAAILEGSTMVRIGTAIFGGRN